VRRLAPLAVAAALLALPAVAAGAKPLRPLGHACQAQNGVRFCGTKSDAQRVPSFDGVPLDADVTLPASGRGPFPTLVLMHGYGGSKASFESAVPDPVGAGFHLASLEAWPSSTTRSTSTGASG
jgi:predicted dienelactone hydrolase